MAYERLRSLLAGQSRFGGNYGGVADRRGGRDPAGLSKFIHAAYSDNRCSFCSTSALCRGPDTLCWIFYDSEVEPYWSAGLWRGFRLLLQCLVCGSADRSPYFVCQAVVDGVLLAFGPIGSRYHSRRDTSGVEFWSRCVRPDPGRVLGKDGRRVCSSGNGLFSGLNERRVGRCLGHGGIQLLRNPDFSVGSSPSEIENVIQRFLSRENSGQVRFPCARVEWGSGN